MEKVIYFPVAVMFLLFAAGCATEDENADNSEQGKANTSQEQVEESDSTSEEAVNQENATNAEASKESSNPPETLTKAKAGDLLIELKETFRVETNNGNVVTNYGTLEALQQHFESIMSENLAQKYMNYYFHMENGELKIVATEEPAWFDPEVDYSLKEENASTYHVIQEKQSELYGNREYTYTLKAQEDGTWIVSNVSSEEMEMQGLTQGEAEELVREHLQGELGDNMVIQFDHMEQGNYVVHVFENMETHTATYGWYEVNPETEEVTSMF
ncbi:hypothetical protein [Oceanobacillus kapialis]|uniref:hypothetical protein n=1 Tax=Oceanobacillus kapialis TaxID=481353 RepID=UPI0038511C6C